MTHVIFVARRFRKFLLYHQIYGEYPHWPAGVWAAYTPIRHILGRDVQASLDEIRALFQFEGCSLR